MDAAALFLCKQIQNARFAYVQSDEISVLCTDYTDINTDPWFGGNIQKIASVSASAATVAFNLKATELELPPTAQFDSRVFIIPSLVEVENYFIWRQKDAERNSLQMLARSLHSHKEMHGKNSAQLHDMLHEKGVNWNNLETSRKRGRAFITGQEGKWLLDNEMPILTVGSRYIRNNIPNYREFSEDLPNEDDNEDKKDNQIQ